LSAVKDKDVFDSKKKIKLATADPGVSKVSFSSILLVLLGLLVKKSTLLLACLLLPWTSPFRLLSADAAPAAVV
jgi:hypothetical protein